MSLLNYQQAQVKTESPKQTEYRLFAQVTRALMEAEGHGPMAVIKAVDWNRRMWIALQADCASEQNALSQDIRAGIISLAIWVNKHSRDVIKKKAEVQPLIDVNRTIMAGLSTA